MFKKITNKQYDQYDLDKNLWIICYDALKSNPNTNQKCIEAFSDELEDNCYIIYTLLGDEIEVLGKFLIDNMKIDESQKFSIVKELTLRSFGIQSTDVLSKLKYIHLEQWMFDLSLKNEKVLKVIFNHIIQLYQDDYLFWFEYSDELVFYPTKYPAGLLKYVTEKLLDS